MKALKPLTHVPLSVRRFMAAERKIQKQAAFERRWKCRQLLFAKAGGSMKRLTDKEKMFVRSVREEAYQAYLHLWRTGISRYTGGKHWIRIQREGRQPLRRAQYSVVWFGSQKVRYFRHDLPRILKQNVKGTNDAPTP